MADVSKPCDMPCEKCGSAEIYRRFRQRGSQWQIEDYGKPHNRYASASSYLATSCRDHIAHTCRTCGHNWQTLPMRKPRKQIDMSGG